MLSSSFHPDGSGRHNQGLVHRTCNGGLDQVFHWMPVAAIRSLSLIPELKDSVPPNPEDLASCGSIEIPVLWNLPLRTKCERFRWGVIDKNLRVGYPVMSLRFPSSTKENCLARSGKDLLCAPRVKPAESVRQNKNNGDR